MGPKRQFTTAQDNIIISLFKMKKTDRLTNVFIENEFMRDKILFKVLENRYNGN